MWFPKTRDKFWDFGSHETINLLVNYFLKDFGYVW